MAPSCNQPLYLPADREILCRNAFVLLFSGIYSELAASFSTLCSKAAVHCNVGYSYHSSEANSSGKIVYPAR